MCVRDGRWLMYVTAEEDVQRLMRLLGEAQADWKAFTVSPNRATAAMGAIKPRVVVFDANLTDVQTLQREARGHCCRRTLVTSDADVRGLSQILSSLQV